MKHNRTGKIGYGAGHLNFISLEGDSELGWRAEISSDGSFYCKTGGHEGIFEAGNVKITTDSAHIRLHMSEGHPICEL